MSFVNAVMTPRATLSNVPAAEQSGLGSTPNLEDDNASTNVSINDYNNDGFSEGVSDEHQAKQNVGTKIKVTFKKKLYVWRKGRLTL